MNKRRFLVIMVIVFSMLYVLPAFASGVENGSETAQDLIVNGIDQDSLIQITTDLMAGTVGPIGNRIYNNRTQGTPNGDLAIKTAVDDFKSWGLDRVEIWENPAVLNNVWYLKTWQISTDAYTFLPYGNWPCRNSPAGDVTAPLIYVGAGTSDADYQGKDVSGKIVLADGSAGSAYSKAMSKGAIGLVKIDAKGSYNPDTGYNDHPYSSEIVKTSSIGTYSASNTIPAITISYDDGQNLKAILATPQAVTLHLMVDTEFRSNEHSDSVIATINGTVPGPYFMLYGHLNSDSYGPGCDDNASGVACIMEIARVMQKLIDEGQIQRPTYSIKFFLVGSELQDSPAYLNSLTAEEKANMIGSINFDQAGYNVEHDINNIEASDKALSQGILYACKDILEDYPDLDQYFQYIPYLGGSDHQAFFNAGVPTCYIWNSWSYRSVTNPPEWGGDTVWIAGNPYYHTSADTMENTVLREPENEVNIAKMCALVATRMANRYTVTFEDYDGTVLGTSKVDYNKEATAPSAPTRAGYAFTGWDKEFSKITGGLTVTAQYEETQYNGSEAAQELISDAISQDSLIDITWDLMTGDVGPLGNQVYNNRTQGTPNGDLAIETVVDYFNSWGLDDVEVWTNPTASNNIWYLKSWQIETDPTDQYTFLPDGNWPARNSPAGDITAPLVYVGVGTSADNYVDGDGNSIVTDKIVLFDGSARTAYPLAIAKGAVGAIKVGTKGNYTPDNLDRPYTTHPYSSEVVTVDRINYANTNTAPAICISYDDGANLKELLDDGTVTLHLMVDAEFINSAKSESVIATINGTVPGPYFMLYGHLNSDSYGPGCDDNASGVACIMEIARVMQTLIDEGKIERPRYSIKFFLIGSELQDSPAYLDSLSSEELANMIGSINFDQAGLNVEHDINNMEASDEELSQSILLACKSILEDYTDLDEYFQFIPYEGGSDHDAFLKKGVPTAYIWSDWTYFSATNPPEWGGDTVWIAGNPYYHTSADTMENTVLREPWNEVNIARLVSLVATRMINQQHTVTFLDYDWTTVLGTSTVDFNQGAMAPADPEREGYTFTGWDKDFSHITGDLTVTAQYAINQYTVTFVDYDEITVLGTSTVDYNTAATAPADPTRSGYTFTGWNKDFSHVTGDLTVTASYKKNRTGGGSSSSGDSDSDSDSDSEVVIIPPSSTIEEPSVPGTASNPVLRINGKIVSQTDTKVLIIDNRTLVPVRTVMENLGYTVNYRVINGVGTITVTYKDMEVTLYLNNKQALVNGVARELDVAPIIKDGHTYIPLRFLAECFGCNVNWDGSKYIVDIQSVD